MHYHYKILLPYLHSNYRGNSNRVKLELFLTDLILHNNCALYFIFLKLSMFSFGWKHLSVHHRRVKGYLTLSHTKCALLTEEKPVVCALASPWEDPNPGWDFSVRRWWSPGAWMGFLWALPLPPMFLKHGPLIILKCSYVWVSHPVTLKGIQELRMDGWMDILYSSSYCRQWQRFKITWFQGLTDATLVLFCILLITACMCYLDVLAFFKNL